MCGFKTYITIDMPNDVQQMNTTTYDVCNNTEHLKCVCASSAERRIMLSVSLKYFERNGRNSYVVRH
jgi:hypothetical protein